MLKQPKGFIEVRRVVFFAVVVPLCGYFKKRHNYECIETFCYLSLCFISSMIVFTPRLDDQKASTNTNTKAADTSCEIECERERERV